MVVPNIKVCYVGLAVRRKIARAPTGTGRELESTPPVKVRRVDESVQIGITWRRAKFIDNPGIDVGRADHVVTVYVESHVLGSQRSSADS